MPNASFPAVPPHPAKLAFIVTEDWFFASHFLPMVQAAREAGLEPLVITRVRDHASVIEAAGARVVQLNAERGSFNPIAAAAGVLSLRSILRRESVHAVHCIGLRAILVGGAACSLAGIRRRLYAVTGLGFLGARRDALGRLASVLLRHFIRSALETSVTHYVFENRDDPKAFGLDPDGSQVTILGGAGIHPGHYAPTALAVTGPLRVALVARMLWSKGVDLAVEAVVAARREGIDVRLSLYGLPDPSNPKCIGVGTLESWAAEDGVAWNGFASDVRAVWARHQVACLPSRGGEGLPRTLLEAAACGCALLTTDVPGCREFVRDGIDGYVVRPGSALDLKNALVQMARDRDGLARMGKSARDRVVSAYTEQHVRERISAIYRAWSLA